MSQIIRRRVLDRSPTLGSHLNPIPSVPLDVGLSASELADLADRVSRALAETYALYLRTVGPIYCNLDKLTRRECEALIPAIDESAECIRSIGRAFSSRFATDSEPSAKDEDPAPEGRHDDGEGDTEERPLAVTTFIRRLRAGLGIPVDPESPRTVHLRS